jgi:N-acetylglucosamine-6-phosphate deacetylase
MRHRSNRAFFDGRCRARISPREAPSDSSCGRFAALPDISQWSPRDDEAAANGPPVVLAGRLAQNGQIVEGWIEVTRTRISRVGAGKPPPGANAWHGLIAPGFCDLQVNGAAGENVTDGPAALDAIDAVQLTHGVTSYLPTIITTSADVAQRAVDEIAERVRDPSSPVVGIHLEGPFLNPEHRGVHRGDFLAKPADGEPAYYRSDAVRLVTLAPELPGALALISSLRRRGVRVAIGHTGASAEEARAAARNGATAVTHLFNGMRGFHHRAPNVAGWALGEANVAVTVIADGVHVDPGVLRLVRRAAASRVILVTDASAAAAAPDGAYDIAGVPIHAEGGRVRDSRGVHAGSALTLDEAVRRWARFTGAPLAEAVAAASERPARLLGLRAGLRAGAPADLVLLGRRGRVAHVMSRGRWVGG